MEEEIKNIEINEQENQSVNQEIQNDVPIDNESQETNNEPEQDVKDEFYYEQSEEESSSNKKYYESEIKKALEDKTLVVGFNSVMSQLKKNTLKSIFCSSNVPNTMFEELTHYSKINNVELRKISIDNEILGVFCKKQYLISTVGVKKE